MLLLMVFDVITLLVVGGADIHRPPVAAHDALAFSTG